jgi:hypothetical protein
LPLASSTLLPGPGSFAAKITSTGRFAVELSAAGPKVGSTDGIAILLYDESRGFLFGVGVTGHGSPDRTIVALGPSGPEAPAGLGVRVRDAGTDACPYSCMEFDVTTPPGAVRHVVAWSAGLAGAVRLDVFGAAGTTAAVSTGTSAALGDPEIQNGSPNVQVQRRVVGFHGAGAKVMREAVAQVDVEHRLFGFWGATNAKFACNFTASVCAGPTDLDNACRAAAGMGCDGASLGWVGPPGSGAGARSYFFSDVTGGPWGFRVHHKADAYDPAGGAYEPATGTLVFAGEHYSALSVADVAWP